MASIVQDPYTQVSTIIENFIRDEFDDLPYFQVHQDRIHESLGMDMVCHVGISPDDTEPLPKAIQSTSLTIQFYNAFDKDVDPFQEVDPRIVTNQAERMTRALAADRSIATPQAWFFTVGRVRFPADPTGNKSRFEMEVTITGNNTGLMETIG